MQNSAADIPAIYTERLAPGLPLFVAITLAGPMVALSFLPMGEVLALTLGLSATVSVIIIAIIASPRITVKGSTLFAGRAHIDTKWLGTPQELIGAEAKHARGAGLDARGWHLIRSGIDGIVVIPVTDANDPVSTWTISTRTPDRLAAAVRRSQQASTAQSR